MPALASNTRPPLAVAVEPVPACHAGGRGFESRRSRKSTCKSAYCVAGSDTNSGPTTQTCVREAPKPAKTARNASEEPRLQAVSPASTPPRDSRRPLHKMAGGHALDKVAEDHALPLDQIATARRWRRAACRRRESVGSRRRCGRRRVRPRVARRRPRDRRWRGTRGRRRARLLRHPVPMRQ